MRGFKQFKKIIENNSISRNFDNFVTSHIHAKKGDKTPLEKLHSLDEMIDKKLTSLPFQIDEFIYNEFKSQDLKKKEKKDRDDDDKNNKDDDDDFYDGMKMPIIPRLGANNN